MRALTNRRLALAAGLLAFGALAAGEPRPSGEDLAALAADIDAERDHISALELGQWLERNERGLRVFDLRPRAEYDELHVPGAEHATLDQLVRTRFAADEKVVFYSEGGAHAAQAWVLLRANGVRQVWFLREGMYEWIARVLEPRLPPDPTPRERADYELAVPLSRYFGGLPRRDVPRSEIPIGYWTNADVASGSSAITEAVRRIRRRGC